MDIEPLDSADPKLQPIIDSVIVSLETHKATHHIREISERRRARLREVDLRDAAHRIAVAFAMFLPPDAPMPSDDFLREHAERVLDGYDGVTRAPRKVE